MKFVNLTPHAVDVYGQDGEIMFSLPADRDRKPARLAETVVGGETMGEVAVKDVKLGAVTPDLPPMRDGVMYVVSMPLLQGMMAIGYTRQDLVYPYDMVRDSGGRILGCRAFARLTR